MCSMLPLERSDQGEVREGVFNVAAGMVREQGGVREGVRQRNSAHFAEIIPMASTLGIIPMPMASTFVEIIPMAPTFVEVISMASTLWRLFRWHLRCVDYFDGIYVV